MPSTGTDASKGMQLAREGRFAEALPYLERANLAAPADVPVLNAVGNLLVLAGRGNDAQQRYRAAAERLPDDLKLLCGWARVSLMMRLPAQAVECFTQALASQRNCGNPGGWLESILFEVAEPETAAGVTTELVARQPGHSGLRAVHAKMLLACERLDEARAALEAYAAMCPHDDWVRVELGGLATGRGDTASARAHFRAVHAHDPNNPDALWGLAELDGFRPPPQVLAAIRRAIALKPSLRAQARLHETLARCHDHADEFPAAWRHAARANAMHVQATPEHLRYQPAQHEARIDILLRHYDRAQHERLANSGNPDPRPLFIVGLPRSGTTLLERMLASHPRIVGVGEQRLAEAGWRRALAACAQDHAALMGPAVTAASAWHLQGLEQRVRNLGLDRHAERIVDKLPDNYLMAGWLAMAFPRATIVHIQRDPRDVALSCWFCQFGADAQWINELRHIAHRIEQHRRLLRHWRAVLGERMVELRYEDLVAAPATQVRRVLDAAGMDWHPDVLSFAERAGYVTTASRMQVRESIHARSQGRWRHYAVALEPILARLETIAQQDAAETDMMEPPQAVALTEP